MAFSSGEATALITLIGKYGDAMYSFALAEERGTGRDEEEAKTEALALANEIRAMLGLDAVDSPFWD